MDGSPNHNSRVGEKRNVISRREYPWRILICLLPRMSYFGEHYSFCLFSSGRHINRDFSLPSNHAEYPLLVALLLIISVWLGKWTVVYFSPLFHYILFAKWKFFCFNSTFHGTLRYTAFIAIATQRRLIKQTLTVCCTCPSQSGYLLLLIIMWSTSTSFSQLV